MWPIPFGYADETGTEDWKGKNTLFIEFWEGGSNVCVFINFTVINSSALSVKAELERNFPKRFTGFAR